MDPREVVALVNPRHSRADVQARALVAWAAARGWSLARTVDPTPDALGVVCEDVRQGRVEGAVAVRLDVLGDLVEQEAVRAVLTRLGGQLFIVNESDRQELEQPATEVRDLLRLYDQRMSILDSQVTGARLKRGASKKRAESGRSGGRTQYGWRMVAGQIVEDAAEQAARRRIAALWARGESYSAIGRQLSIEGYKKRDGTSTVWHPDIVRRIVMRLQQEEDDQEPRQDVS